MLNVLVCAHIWYVCIFLFQIVLVGVSSLCSSSHISKLLLSYLTVNGSNRGSKSVIECFVVVLCSKFNGAGWENFFHMNGSVYVGLMTEIWSNKRLSRKGLRNSNETNCKEEGVTYKLCWDRQCFYSKQIINFSNQKKTLL